VLDLPLPSVEALTDERRSFPRYQVNLVAEVRDAAGVARRARVRDLCLGGALLAGLDDSWLATICPGVTLELRFVLAASSGIATMPVRAKVARVIGRGLGVQFDASPGPALDGLRHFIDRILARAREGKGEEKGAQRPSKASRTRAAMIVRRFGIQRNEEILNAWLEAAASALFQSLDRATHSDHKQQLADDSARVTRLRGAGGATILLAWLEDGESKASRQSEPPGAASELELVDPEGFEAWLEASALVSRLEDELGESLPALEAQIRNALGSDARLQLAPKRLAEAFNTWGKSQDISTLGRRVAMRAGRQVLPRLLRAYYRDLGRVLDEAGFPKVRVPAPVVSAKEGGTARIDEGEEGEPEASPTDHPEPRAIGSRDGRGTSARVAELLAALPPDALQGAAGDTRGSIKEQALRLLGQLDTTLDGESMPPSVHERIDATDRVLGQIAGKQALTPRSAEWASQLGVPILTAAVSDPEFFRPPGHPLLQLLERLNHLALFLPTDRDADRVGLVQELDGLVQRAFEQDARDREAFRPLLDSVGTLERRRGERYRQDVGRLIWQLEKRDRRRAALAYVRAGLAQRFAARPMHRVVAEVIDEAWATLLQLRYLREGDGGEQLARGWQVLEGLVALCSGGGAGVAEGIDALSMELLTGLTSVGLDPFLAQDVTRRVREAARLQAAGLTRADDCPIYQTPLEPKLPVEVALAGLMPEQAAGLKAQVEGLSPGALIRRRDSSGERPLRLIWSNPERSEFALLDGRDGDLRSLSREALLMGLNSGDLAVQAANAGTLGERVLDAALQEMQAQMRDHETRDRLTGLHSQHHLTGQLAEVLARPVGGEHLLGFVSIDHFDVITGTCGYGAGEELLRAVGGLMRERLGLASSLSFLGGWRFGFLLPPDEPEANLGLCEQLCRDIYGMRFEWNGRAQPVTGSVGAVLVRPGQGEPDGLLSAAAVACTTAQEGGGNRVQVFREDDEAISESRDRLRWLGIVEEVIRAERIRLQVQKIAPLDPESGRTAHHEVLMRAFDAQGAELDLQRFIGTAEAFHLMGDVDRLVIRKAISWAGENPDLLSRLGGIAINLSGVSLANPGLLGVIQDQLARSQVAPSQVSFEVTETAAIANLNRAVTIIRGLRGVGCRVALDDFGVGMSSYGYLKSLPVDFVKIDGFFVREILTNPHDQAIVKSMNEIAHFMGIQTIAEFVENDEIAGRLAQIGVDFVQGYAVRKPLFLDHVKPDY
jgi:diguanylate cyclase (GGDEF)-like protein